MIFSVAYFILYFSLFLVLLALLVFNRKSYTLRLKEQPAVSILIAARNEEHTILRCLQAIGALDYPKDKIEVLIGDDASTDNTRAVVEAFILGKPHYTCISITHTLGKARGKANVLAHLAKHATTDFFFYTDADIAVPPQWIKAMLSGLEDKVGVVTGITTTEGKSLFARLQTLDWLYSLGLMQVVSDVGLRVTTMGNNMLLRRQAYEQVGGYESIDFSVTEDIAIFNQVLRRGWGFRNIYDQHVLALSTPASTFTDFLQQRRRWMRGSMHLPVYMAVIFILYSAYYPVLLPFFAYTSVGVMLAIFGFKLLLQSVFLHLCLRRLGRSARWYLYPLFELYMLISMIILILYFFLPVKISWKGRKY
ncbi:glycosyltransferase [Pontibacter chinhatensis]|uniref:Glycosyltransferase, catalytic subunit of cellulose synthase and poly-beta-1,6-N-acetylglucosamine synthase n=1 Tax=Pontibacter chinhatensis TaxID=1436961 RepID=A0A1I2ZC70_9BACT|nr:glycosyltransferase [Pontibacter chinhatensis]SFH35437.1 Glycosyltransferase, catalytic subunit of cellulose synthase and poly-beta-1,6-N-acetylglucosamine synthase [Pontibacter chinhatensis]